MFKWGTYFDHAINDKDCQMIRLHNLSYARKTRKRNVLMSYENAPDHVKLAVELIQFTENIGCSEETALEASLLMLQDILNKLPPDQRESWRNKLYAVFVRPGRNKPIPSASEP